MIAASNADSIDCPVCPARAGTMCDFGEIGHGYHIERIRKERPTLPAPIVVTPFIAPRAPRPEPEATLRFGNIEVRITLTYLHHLRNLFGYGDRSSYTWLASDEKYHDALQAIEAAMWIESDRTKELPR